MAGLIPGLLAWRAGAHGLSVSLVAATVAAVTVTAVLAASAGGLIPALLDAQVLVAVVALNVVLVAARSVEIAVAVRHWPPEGLLHPGMGTSDAPVRVRRVHLAQARRHAARVRALAAALGVVFVASPHLLVAHQADLLRSTLDGVFVNVASAAVDVPTGASMRHDEVRLTATADTRGAAPEGNEVDAGADGIYTALLIGLDAGAGRQGARNDANLVVTVDPATGSVALVGIPRNFVRMPLPGSDDCDCFRAPLFALYGYGQQHADRYPGSSDPGADAVRQSVAALIGREIDHYLVADLGAFLDLVDALGGVTISVDEALTDSKSDPWDIHARVSVDLAPGTHQLDGAEVLSYVRSRHDSDYGRMARQRCVVAALNEPTSRLTPLQALDLLGTVRGRLVSDIPRQEVPALLDLARRVDRGSLRSLGLVPPTFVAARWDGYPEPDREAVRAAVRDLPAHASGAEGCPS